MSNNVNDGFIDIHDHGLLIIKGPDAFTFLQGQVTCDVEQLAINDGQSQSSLGAHCTHKGRMLFSFRACALSDDTIALCIYRELIPSAISALKKYSVFSKVELIDASDSYTITGLVGDTTTALEQSLPSLPAEPDRATQFQGAVIIRIGNQRYECWVPNDATSSFIPDDKTPLDNNVWTAKNIADGIAEVRPETVEEFIPQMLNFQVVSHGISFTKGCYTGQEVVARMQYLGKLKRRMYRFETTFSGPIQPGTPLFSSESKQPIGHVVLSATVNTTQELLAVVTEEAVNQNKVYLDGDCQQKLHALPLPYAITKE